MRKLTSLNAVKSELERVIGRERGETVLDVLIAASRQIDDKGMIAWDDVADVARELLQKTIDELDSNRLAAMTVRSLLCVLRVEVVVRSPRR
jgi:hypothetical protein